MKKLALLFFVAIGHLLNAQDRCGHLMAQDYLFKHDPTARQRVDELMKAAEEQGNTQARTSSVTPTYTIPVVFHVLHQNGTENISDLQIIDQINVMNRDYAKLNADTANVVQQFQGLIGQPNVTFRLATIDPDGNCTNGITRHYDTKTDWMVDFNYYTHSWDRTKYLNIYVVRNMPQGVAAYSYYPGSVPAAADAIVVKSIYVGSIGTSQPYTARVITHEAGHWMNLQHLWGGTNQPGVACGDDGVSDTPITKGYTYCNLNNAIDCTPGVVENIQNYMEYAYCQLMFTPGQCTRMHNALNSPTAGRNNIWSTSNLIATGVINPMVNCAPVAAFASTSTITCVGSAVSFTDESYNAPINAWKWSSPLASNISIQQNGQLTFTASGVAPVKLKVSNAYGADSTVQQTMIVLAAQGTGSVGITQGFENGPFPDNEWIATTPQYGSAFSLTNSAAYNGNNSVWVNNFFNNPNGPVSFFTPAFDFQSVSSATLSFYYAYAQKAAANNDQLKIYGSYDCGASWVQLYSSNGSSLSTTGSPLNTPYNNPNLGEWQQVFVDAGPMNSQPRVYFKFEFTPDTLGAGNNIFIDDINMDATYTAMGIAPHSLQQLVVSPNPFVNAIGLSGDGVKDVTAVKLFDVSGRLLVNHTNLLAENNKLEINGLEQLAPGVYFMRVDAGPGSRTLKMIKE